MKKYLLILVLILVITACRKRSNIYSFAGVWEITKIEQKSYSGDTTLLDLTIENDTLGWFALQTTNSPNASGNNYQGKIAINFSSLSGLATDYNGIWDMDEHISDRIQLNKIIFMRERFVGGEKWSWFSSQNSGSTYSRETIYVKHK